MAWTITVAWATAYHILRDLSGESGYLCMLTDFQLVTIGALQSVLRSIIAIEIDVDCWPEFTSLVFRIEVKSVCLPFETY
jgi:hypothetical protein